MSYYLSGFVEDESHSPYLSGHAGYCDITTMPLPADAVVTGSGVSDPDVSTAEAPLEQHYSSTSTELAPPRYLRQIVPEFPDILSSSLGQRRPPKTPPPTPENTTPVLAIESLHEDTRRPETMIVDDLSVSRQSTWGDPADTYHFYDNCGTYLDYLTTEDAQHEPDMGSPAPETLSGPEIERGATLIPLAQAIHPFMDGPFPIDTPPASSELKSLGHTGSQDPLASGYTSEQGRPPDRGSYKHLWVDNEVE